MIIPRLQGKVGQATEPPEMVGKYFFTIWITALNEPHWRKELGPFGPWDTKETAERELSNAAQMICEEVEKLHGGQVTGEYFDLKTNLRRKWGDKVH